MKRRAFLLSLLAAPLAAAGLRKVPMFVGESCSFGNRFITTGVYHGTIEIKKMMARIRITGEAMEDACKGAFVAAARQDYASVVRDIQAREERALLQGLPVGYGGGSKGRRTLRPVLWKPGRRSRQQRRRYPYRRRRLTVLSSV